MGGNSFCKLHKSQTLSERNKRSTNSPLWDKILWALTANTFLESTARIQRDRNQTVCKNGPYKIIRHPMYTTIIIWYFSIALTFETTFVSIISVIIVAVIIIRTYLEDQLLINELLGYVQYTNETKYRLIPFIW